MEPVKPPAIFMKEQRNKQGTFMVEPEMCMKGPRNGFRTRLRQCAKEQHKWPEWDENGERKCAERSNFEEVNRK
jgi:hypothetical protein